VPQNNQRIPFPPSNVPEPLYSYLLEVARRLNAEAYISKFSGTHPNTSGFSGIPGDLAINVGSASSFSRLFIKGGAEASASTISWSIVRIAR
jgi:hypothetical protein